MIHVANHEGDIDLALIDAVAVNDPYVGSLELFDPETMVLAILTQADPIAIGFSSVGGLLQPVTGEDDHALLVRFASIGSGRDEMVIKAPTAPGHYASIGIHEVSTLPFDETVAVNGEVLLAFDGERKLRVRKDQTVYLSVRRDGPQVIDPARAVTLGRFVMINP